MVQPSLDASIRSVSKLAGCMNVTVPANSTRQWMVRWCLASLWMGTNAAWTTTHQAHSSHRKGTMAPTVRRSVSTRPTVMQRARRLDSLDDGNPPWDERFTPNVGLETLLTSLDSLDSLNTVNTWSESSHTRRHVLGWAVVCGGSLVSNVASAESISTSTSTSTPSTRLPWHVTPVNKRTGVTLTDAERTGGYTVAFVTYLSRLLLTLDPKCRTWWYQRGLDDIAKTATADDIRAIRMSHFAAFAASVEVGLLDYSDTNDGAVNGIRGPERLLASLIQRYCSETATPTSGPVSVATVTNSTSVSTAPSSSSSSTSSSTRRRQERERQEARRQICLLFALLTQTQPVAALTRQLAALDNGSLARVVVSDGGTGYAPGYGPPAVHVAPPEAGDEYVTATARATLSPTGRLLRLDVGHRGGGYLQAPTVTIAPPLAVAVNATKDTPTPMAQAATAEATLFRSGPNKGRIERITLTSLGAGYTEKDVIRIRISPPDTKIPPGGVGATATAVLEYQVADILIVNNGTGYAVERPIRVTVDPPPATARINLNDPLAVALWDGGEGVRKAILDNATVTRLGRGTDKAILPMDRPVVAVAYPASHNNKNVFTSFRKSDDVWTADTDMVRTSLPADESSYYAAKSSGAPRRTVSAAAAGDLPAPVNIVTSSAASDLLSLLPAGVGLEYNTVTHRYDLAVDPNYPEPLSTWWNYQNSDRKIDPDFGPRGRSPIERDMQLGLSTYLRFILSGAICSSGVHLVLTPIDVVKTKVQTDPVKYPGVIRSLGTVWEEEGASGFLKGWAPTFLGFFLWGGISYTLTEFIRRTLTDSLGAEAGSYEVPIILLAAAVGAFMGSFILCPFESVRIRSVSQTDYAPDIWQVVLRMTREEGIPSLFAAVPVFLVKEIPFAMAKFTVFDLSTAYMYSQFPAAKEDLQLSLLVSLLGGTLGGMTAAVVSNPADVTISTLKKRKSSDGALATAQTILAEGGPSAFFRGLPLRLIFYALLVSLQFLVYDSIRFALGIGSDDLKLYLDVLGGALSERS